MQNKKNYNNLLESIVMTIILIIITCFYLMMIYFGVLHPKAGTNPIITLVVGTVIFGGLLVLSVIIILIWCYEYWYIDGESISSKKIFRKKKKILISQIKRVEKRVVDALIFGTYHSEIGKSTRLNSSH